LGSPAVLEERERELEVRVSVKKRAIYSEHVRVGLVTRVGSYPTQDLKVKTINKIVIKKQTKL
jgi:hypothetical protein